MPHGLARYEAYCRLLSSPRRPLLHIAYIIIADAGLAAKAIGVFGKQRFRRYATLHAAAPPFLDSAFIYLARRRR